MRLGLIAVVALCASTAFPFGARLRDAGVGLPRRQTRQFPADSLRTARLAIRGCLRGLRRQTRRRQFRRGPRTRGWQADSPRHRPHAASGDLVIIGVLGQSAVIDELVRAGKLDAADLTGQWEAFRRVVVERPFPKVARALVIVGSDRRGAVFGAYDLSAQIGVSPWYWFADVPPRQQKNVYHHRRIASRPTQGEIPRLLHQRREPRLQRLGAEAVRRHQLEDVRARVRAAAAAQGQLPVARDVGAEGVQRRRSAEHDPGRCHGRRHGQLAPRADDARAERVAPEQGQGRHRRRVELRHQRREPAQVLARRHRTDDVEGQGQRYESVVTVGMRGDGDEAMAEGTAIPLLESVVADQRKIIATSPASPRADAADLGSI